MNKDKTKKSKVSPLVGAGLGTVAGGPVGAVAGASITRGVNKERDRYAKKGARSHLGKVGHDAKLGAKSLGLGSALAGGLAGAALGFAIPVKKKGFLGLGRDKKAENQQRLKNTLSGAGLGALGYGTSGAIKGAGTGALVGATRGFVQENKTKNKKMKNYTHTLENFADFASRWKKTLSPDSVAAGKQTGQSIARNKALAADTTLKYNPAELARENASDIARGKQLGAKGKENLARKAASSNRTMRPTTPRNNLTVQRPNNKKVVQAFKQKAQQQVKPPTPTNNPIPSSASRPRPSTGNTGRTKLPSNPLKTPKVTAMPNVGKVPFNKTSRLGKIARNISINRVPIGAAVAGLGVAGGLYAAKKSKERKQGLRQRFFNK